MAIGTSKMLLLGASTASVGGVSAGALLLPNMKGEKGIELTSAKEDTATPEIVKKCVVYVTNVPTGTNSNQSVTEILSKYTNISDFLKDKESTNSTFVEDVKKACSGNGEKKFVDSGEEMHVYIYEKTESNGTKKWIYSSDLQQDWMKREGVDKTKLTS
ncbi:hypothetical protein HF1_10540 [Mycoplasma haemofelis str. Langford 1]|uniref:Uncharacterized protein n=1 Tax=Mycoplasma haemofelis (strain Langford 1) TaxID=941640 RepID=E8ZIU1_MYCHL|nr:hypothetical protein [Mycoplasma haemofelis]CBY93062.1 hypothetical protein HF1_10540 [Mycoplasma haemofelis str. Langford 1]